MNTTNIFAVGVTPPHPVAKPELEGQQLTVLIPQFGALTTDQALNLAAWIVALVDPLDEKFTELLTAIKNT